MNVAELLYGRSPVFLQNAACTLVGLKERRLRYGGAFKEYCEFLDESQWWSKSRIEAWQFEHLSRLLDHCYRHVPYYKTLWQRHGVSPADITCLADLRKLPVLKKSDIPPNLERMIADEQDRSDLQFCHTGGTTGTSLQFYMPPQIIQFRWALFWRHRKRFNIAFDSPFATFTGLVAVPLLQARPPFWRSNLFMKQTIFTMHHIVPDKAKSIVDRLNRGGFEYYSGYPSILSTLAGLVVEQNLKITRPPKVVFTGAENLYDNQRALISDVFGCPVTDLYGFSEGCGNASRCEHDRYHEDFELGILECGEPERIDAHTTRGKILATGLRNEAMPFIRYEVGDVGVWSDEPCACGRHSRVLTGIDGRDEDFVLTPEGARIMRFDYIFKDTVNVREAQVVQKEPGQICIRIVKRPGYAGTDEAYIRSEIKAKISERLQVDFEYTPEIERGASGKFRAVVSSMKQPH